jgi:glutamate-1-semialdehyde 2,1-aminomutase
MFQYYLKAEGLAFSWVGTGRFIFSLNYSDADFAMVVDKIVRAARAMHADGWWWSDAALTHKLIRRRVLKEILVTYWARLRGRTSTPWHGGPVGGPVPQGAQARALEPIGSISSPRSR